MRHQRGFSLIELLVVLAIAGLMTGLAVAGLGNGQASVEQALQQLLAGSGMSWQFSEARTVTLRKAEAAPQAVNLKPIEVSVASRTSTCLLYTSPSPRDS